MKIQQSSNINTSSRSKRKQTQSTAFGSLLSSEMQPNTAAENSSTAGDESNNPEQQREVFQQATHLLDQALQQWEIDGKLTDTTMQSIQQARQQLGSLSADNPILAQAETVLAVESTRLKKLNH